MLIYRHVLRCCKIFFCMRVCSVLIFPCLAVWRVSSNPASSITFLFRSVMCLSQFRNILPFSSPPVCLSIVGATAALKLEGTTRGVDNIFLPFSPPSILAFLPLFAPPLFHPLPFCIHSPTALPLKPRSFSCEPGG